MGVGVSDGLGGQGTGGWNLESFLPTLKDGRLLHLRDRDPNSSLTINGTRDGTT